MYIAQPKTPLLSPLSSPLSPLVPYFPDRQIPKMIQTLLQNATT